jgi:SNF2 family DNA or RNA helicase
MAKSTILNFFPFYPLPVRLNLGDLFVAFLSKKHNKMNGKTIKLSYQDVVALHRGIEIDEKEEKNEIIVSLNDINLPKELIERMYDHQKEGVQWMYGLYIQRLGGILGDDMGLGKTFQVSTLLTGLFRMNSIKRVLIVTPVSVLRSWMKELSSHLLPYTRHVGLELISSDIAKAKRIKILKNIFTLNFPTVVVTSYHVLSNLSDSFAGYGTWDYVILDEGHTIKNPHTKLSKSVHELRTNHKLLLTGTALTFHSLFLIHSLIHS